jgi:hypothetical protein
MGAVNWRKVPSVMTGGKQYFYVLFLWENYSREAQAAMGLDYKVSVGWDRRVKKWEVCTGDNFQKSLGFFKTDREGRQFIEARLLSK